jgi:hypothetical protein
MRLTLSMASYLRPQRTMRSIECITNQSINGWEALIVGDGCPFIGEILPTDALDPYYAKAEEGGNTLIVENLPNNLGGFGCHIINQNIERAKGEYFIFYANDDIILPNHFENYLSAIEGTDYDFVYFNSNIMGEFTRNSSLNYGQIGHSELIIRTDFLKKMPKHMDGYGHDWDLIQNMISAGAKYRKADEKPPTYIVKSLANNREQNID